MPSNMLAKILPAHFERIDSRDFVIIWSIIFLFVSVLISCWRMRFITTMIIYSVVILLFHNFAVRPVHPVCLRAFLNGFKVGAHRGLAMDAPENTLGAFILSSMVGADAVEFDLEFTKDGITVILHDDTVDRTTDGVGSISDMNLDKVRSLNAAFHFHDNDKYPFEQIPTFEETIQLLIKLDMKMLIDVKNPHPYVVKNIIEMFGKYDQLYVSAAVCSFFPQVIYSVKRADWRIITGHTWRPGYFTHSDYGLHVPYHEGWLYNKALHWLEELYVWSLHRFFWKVTGASLFLTDQHCVSEEYAKLWRRRGMEVVAWTVNDFHQRLYYLNALKIPFLTDKMSDIQEAMKTPKAPTHDYIAQSTGPSVCYLCRS